MRSSHHGAAEASTRKALITRRQPLSHNGFCVGTKSPRLLHRERDASNVIICPPYLYGLWSKKLIPVVLLRANTVLFTLKMHLESTVTVPSILALLVPPFSHFLKKM